VELQNLQALSASANLNFLALAKTSLNPSLGTGTNPIVPQNPLGRNQVLNNIEQSWQDREARKNQINLDLNLDSRSSDGNLFTLRPANSRGLWA
jgi:hypothetical protein